MSWLPALLFVLVRLHYCSSAATTADTITLNQTLKDGDLLLSSAKSYALGFFTPGNSTGKRYVGIWYRKIPERLVVWVANRNNPVNGTSGILSVDHTGNLVIRDRKTNTSVWNTSLSFPPNTNTNKLHSALLQETGNLVLCTAASKILWQSFDHPTNTLIANMKFGIDTKRGLNLSLTSWKSGDDPGTGEYSMSIEMKGKPQAFLFKNSALVWRLGPWNGIRWSGVPEMTPNITPYIFTENDDEVTEEYSIKDPNIYTIVMLNETGTLNKIRWQGEKWVGNWYYPNSDDCDSYDRCGAFGICNPYNQGGYDCRCVSAGFRPVSVSEWDRRDGRGGCRRSSSTPEECGHGDGFLKVGNAKIPDTERAEVNREMKGLEECEELCRKNCSCTGFAGANISDGAVMGCITWYGELRDMREFTKGGQDMYIRVSASDLLLGQNSKKSKGHRWKWITAIVVLGLVIAALLFLAICLTMTMIKKGKKELINNENIHSFEEGSSPIMGKNMDGADRQPPADVLIFDLNTIRTATDNFSLENKLGEGGFGCVYKGKMGNGELVAVKRLTRSSDQGIEEFKNEVVLIARLQHRNLVRLLGYCIQEGEKMLVYEYLPNKGLDSFLFEHTQGTHLDCRKRFEIILGVAQGLLYLHQDSRLRIIHRDLKASNVLLDASMDPKISDFGMARIFGEEQVEDITNRVVGTYGYMSPEYAMEGQFSAKSDVFSFGILLLEIVTGKKNKHKFNEHSLNLVGDVWNLWNEDKALDVVDPSLMNDESYDVREVLRCIHVGLLCVQPYPDDRPNMSEVVFMLNHETKLPPPNPPGFVFELPKTDQFWSTSTSAGNQSINCVSITAIKGR